MATHFYKDNQQAWFHDEGHTSGFFHTYDSLQLGETAPRKVHIFLPRDYETQTQRYPVVYVNDGNTAFFRGGLANKSWWMAEVLEGLYRHNEICPLILVAIHPVNRDVEYTHAPVFDRPGGGLEAYGNYVSYLLKPFIDRNYLTLPHRESTTILGSSHGGLAAFYIACRHCDRFGNAAALSPSFWVGLDTGLGMFFPLSKSKLIQLTAPTLQNRQNRPKIWIDWGLLRDNGFHNWFIERHATKRGREMAELLQKKFNYILHRDLFVWEDEDGEHTEDSWSRRLPFVFKAFYMSSKR
jgi:predicted alpha/beta superfamily hydrolase